MYIIIVGGGKVGYYLSRTLLESGHEVLLVEKNPQRAAFLIDELGADHVWIGDGCDSRTFEQIGLNRADAVIAVTGDDEDNLVICLLAKNRFGVPRTIARINNPRNAKIFTRLGVDVAVSTTEIIEAQIERALPIPSLVHLLALKKGGVELVEGKIAPGSPADGKRIRDLGIPDDALIVMLVRDDQTIVPYGDTLLQAGDEILAVTSTQSKEVLKHIILGR